MATAAIKNHEVSSSLPRASAPTTNSPKCVLLIEDNEEAMFLVQIALQEHGKGIYNLEWAKGLSDGLERLMKGGVDLVLLDLGLPESSGPASYSWVREAAPHVPVLVLTGDPREETEFAIAASGVEDYLMKDQISGSLLMQAIRAALHRSKRDDEKETRSAKSKENAEHGGARRFVPLVTDCHN